MGRIIWFGVLFLMVLPSAFAAEGSGVARENGILENAQVVFLFLGILGFLVQSFVAARGTRHLFWIGVWFCFSCILRELDVEDFALPRWIIFLGSGAGRNVIGVVGWLLLGTIAIRSFPRLKDRVGEIVRSRTAVLSYIAGGMLLLGLLGDKELVGGRHHQLFEEISEVVGYFLIMVAAFFSGSVFRDSASDVSPANSGSDAT